MRAKLSRVNRVVAGVLSLVWAGAGVGGLITGYLYGRWVIAAVAVVALGYAALWLRVAAQGRLLSWSELAMPWRAR